MCISTGVCMGSPAFVPRTVLLISSRGSWESSGPVSALGCPDAQCMAAPLQIAILLVHPEFQSLALKSEVPGPA